MMLCAHEIDAIGFKGHFVARKPGVNAGPVNMTKGFDAARTNFDAVIGCVGHPPHDCWSQLREFAVGLKVHVPELAIVLGWIKGGEPFNRWRLLQRYRVELPIRRDQVLNDGRLPLRNNERKRDLACSGLQAEITVYAGVSRHVEVETVTDRRQSLDEKQSVVSDSGTQLPPTTPVGSTTAEVPILAIDLIVDGQGCVGRNRSPLNTHFAF